MAADGCHIISIANSKGGVGKSTLATNLAVEGAAAGLEVLLVDTDPQASSTLFSATRDPQRPPFASVQMTKPVLHRELPKLSEPYDLVIVDTMGREGATFRSALAAADSILVPITPSAYDIWASEDVFTVIEEVTATRENLQTRVLLNMVIPRTVIAREALDAIDDLLADQPAILLDSRLHARVAWKMAAVKGLSVREHEPRGAAAKELAALCGELGLWAAG
nr:protein ParA-like [Nerophis lumbriciformis]